MEVFPGEQLAENYEELIDRAASDERIIVSASGKQAALVSLDDLAFLEEVDRKLDQADLAEVKRRLADPAEAPIPFVPGTLSRQRAGG